MTAGLPPFPFIFSQLQTREGLEAVEAQFQEALGASHPSLLDRLLQARSAPHVLSAAQESELLLRLAPVLEAFLCGVFSLEATQAQWLEAVAKAAQTKVPKRLPYDRGALDFPSPTGRDHFQCLTPPPSSGESLQEARACLVCHTRDKDSCRKGLQEKSDASRLRLNAQGLVLSGCPLGQKISQMHALRQKGHILGALAMILVDNPLAVLSGLRICTDCEASCIFQNHQPISTPQVETEIVGTVLNVRWGVEIYALLARWNPLNLRTPLPKPLTGYEVLVVGLGPAGLCLAHYLTQEGHKVWGVDGQKIEPLDPALLEAPVEWLSKWWMPLEERVPQGVGGVAEYGITARWDKNFLTVARILLERRPECLLQGGIRLGSTFTPQEAFAKGLHHIALCLGAGRPHLPEFVTSLPPGVRLASDFLMTLHNGAAFQPHSPTALQLSLPLLVIGGGLTAIDAATEAQAFYIRQVEKLTSLLATLEETGAPLEDLFHPEDWEQLERYRAHGQALKNLSAPQKVAQARQWGGVTLLYRRAWSQAPSMVLNPQEVQAALDQGIQIMDQAVPVGWQVDQKGHVSGVHLEDGRVLAARNVLLATGTSPNTVLFDHWPDLKDDPRVSLWGDLDPAFQGSVVKAMASAKQGYAALSHHLGTLPLPPQVEKQAFSPPLRHLQEACRAWVHTLERDQEGGMTLVVKAPQVACRLGYGQYLKLQQLGRVSEGIALNPVHVDPVEGLITLKIWPRGASTHLLHTLQPGEAVGVMGPLGEVFDRPPQELGLSQAPSALHCMLHQICGQCLQVTLPSTCKTSPCKSPLFRYACHRPWSAEGEVDRQEAQGRLGENRLMEQALWAWVQRKSEKPFLSEG